MSALGKRLEKLEQAKQHGFELWVLDIREGETEDEAKERISAGIDSGKTIIWISELDARL